MVEEANIEVTVKKRDKEKYFSVFTVIIIFNVPDQRGKRNFQITFHFWINRFLYYTN